MTENIQLETRKSKIGIKRIVFAACLSLAVFVLIPLIFPKPVAYSTGMYRTVKDFYELIFKSDVWPKEYLGVPALPQDVKQKLDSDIRKRTREIMGDPLLSYGGFGELYSTAYEPYHEQKISGEVKLLSVSNIRIVGIMKVRLAVTFQSKIGVRKFGEKYEPPKSFGTPHTDELTLQWLDGKWKVIERHPITSPI